MREIPSFYKKMLAAVTGLGIAAGTMVDREAQPASAQTVETVPKEPLTPHEARMEALRRLDTGRTIESKEQVDARFAVIDPLINLAYFKDNTKPMIIQVDRYLGVLRFEPLTEKDAEYARMTLAEVGDALRETIEHGETQKVRDEARRILKGRLHEELIETIRHMGSDDVISRRVFLGTGADDDIRDAWKEKMTRSSTTSEKVREYAPIVIDQLSEKEGGLTLASWIDRQQVAIDTFAVHAEELGYSPELVRQITPEVMLGVIRAERFPFLDAETFVRLAPVLFEMGGFAFAPAKGDKRFSGGLAQMTAETFEGILRKHREDLERIRDTDTGAAFSVPKKGDKKGFSAAMLTDENSQFFFNVFVLAENTRLATRGISKDKRFIEAWGKASEADRSEYMAALISMANNLPSSAKRAAEGALDEHPESLPEMTKRLSSHTTVETVQRNGTVGLETMRYLLLLAEQR